MSDDDVTLWIRRLTGGDEQATEQLFERYYGRLVAIARRKLGALPPAVADEEGAAISAFRSFFSGVHKNQFPQLGGRDDLWRVLATITARKSIAQLRRHWKQRGERDRVQREGELAEFLDREPSPADAVALVDECAALLDVLDDPTLREIAQLRLEGWETDEIAEKLNVHRRTVQRKLAMIRAAWLDIAET